MPDDRLISRAAAKAKKVYSEERHEYVVPVAELDWLPSVPPQVVHGRWVTVGPVIDLCECSECKFRAIRAERNYCPHCGAKMDGGEDDAAR